VITLLTSTFSVAVFTEAWECDNDDEYGIIEDEYADFVEDRRHAPTSSRTARGRGGKAETMGVLERKANTTYISEEVVIKNGAKWNTKV